MSFISRLFKYFVVALILIGAAAAFIRLPSQHVPWGPVDLSAPVGVFTGYKLAELTNDPAACHKALATARIEFRPLPDKTENPSCSRVNLVLLDKSLFPYISAVRANCGLVAAMVVWEKQAVEPAAALHLQSKIKRVDYLGVFACRKVRGSSTRQSQHAAARAIDIKGFLLESGKRVTVKSDWNKDSPEGRFLHDVHDKSCVIFRGILGPDYNRLHADHFHLDMGPYNICR